LLARGCDPELPNRNGSDWTALHAAALQEDAKIVHILLEAGASATVRDRDGRTAVDFATVSSAVWPFFAARGHRRTEKEALLGMGIIRRASDDELVFETPTTAASKSGAGGHAPRGRLAHLNVAGISRPGSAYVRNDRLNAFSTGGGSSRGASGAPFRGSSRGSTAALRARGDLGGGDAGCDLFACDDFADEKEDEKEGVEGLRDFDMAGLEL
jgi:hypothetical protein